MKIIRSSHERWNIGQSGLGNRADNCKKEVCVELSVFEDWGLIYKKN